MTIPHAAPVRFFLDANVLISAAWKPNAEVAGIWRLQGVHLLTSILVMEELQRNLSQMHQVERLRGLVKAVEITAAVAWTEFAPIVPELMFLPEKDRHVLAAACQVRSHYLITGDKKHFSQWFGKTVQGIRIEPPTNLLADFRMRNP